MHLKGLIFYHYIPLLFSVGLTHYIMIIFIVTVAVAVVHLYNYMVNM